ncbi:MAG: Fic family protein [Candidatus Saccharimonadales bacterium]
MPNESLAVPLTAEQNTKQLSPHDTQELAITVRYMERLHASEVFATPEKSKEFLDTLNYDDFKRWIGFVNGVELGIPRTDRGKVGDSFVQSSNALMGQEVEYRPPHISTRDQLLKSAFEKAQSVEDPKVAGLVLGLSINAIHYFPDGNGRTARIAYALLTRGYDGSEGAQNFYSNLLKNTEGRAVVNPNPSESGIDKVIRSEMREAVLQSSGYTEAFAGKMPTYVFDAYPDTFAGEFTPDRLAVSDDIDKQGRGMLYSTLESGGMTLISLMKTFDPDRVKPYVRTSKDGQRTFVDGSKFLPTLSQEDIKNWWNNSELAIANYVQRLINIADRDNVSELVAYYESHPQA